MEIAIESVSQVASAARKKGLAVVASVADARAMARLLPHRDADWTLLALFGADRPDCGQARLVHAGLEDKGWSSRYLELRSALRDLLVRIEDADGPFDCFATHAPADLDAHPAIWHITNVVGGDRPDLPVREFAVRAGASNGHADAPITAEDLLRRPIHGQIIQMPRGASPGIVVSPFWTIPWHHREAARQALLHRVRADRWYAIMADTTFCNLPPSYVLPFIGGRFNVDPEERSYLASRFPDLDLIEFCQSQLTPEQVYKPHAGIEKKFDLVYSARICEVKRHALLLDALEALQREGHRLSTLLLFYPKDNEDTRATTEMVRRRIAESGIDVTFHTTGERGNNEGEVARMLNRARVGLFLSAEEGPAFAIPEYLLCDLPVVACSSLRGGGLYFLNAENSLLFVGPGDLPGALLTALSERNRFRPRQSALAQGIGEEAGNARFAASLAERDIVLRDDARPLNRHLDSFRLKDLCW